MSIITIIVIVGIVFGTIKWITHLKETPEDRKRRQQIEASKSRGDILPEPYSDWPRVGVMSLLAGGAIAAFGLYLLFSDKSKSELSSQLAGIFYGPDIIVSGLLLMIFGILCINTGFSQYSEQRLEALQILTSKQNQYLKSLLEKKAYEDFSSLSGSLIDEANIQNYVDNGRHVLIEKMHKSEGE